MATDQGRAVLPGRFGERCLTTIALTALMLLGCSRPPTPRVGVSDSPPEQAPAPAETSSADTSVPADVVERAGMPFRVLRHAGSEPMDPSEFFDELAKADAVCVAEHHDNPHHHWAQLYVIQELFQRAAVTGRELGVGLEMFQAPFQNHLDAYASGKLDVDRLLENTEYQSRWGFPFAYYAPQIDHAVARGGSLVALNAPREQTRRVAREGFQGLSERELRLLGDYDLHDEEHRAQFDALMQGHPEHPGSKQQLYAAQVLWDESMAQTASDWLGAHTPARQLVILAGSAHCHRSAIPARLERRMRARAVGVKPIVSAEGPPPVDELTEQLSGFDFGFIMSPAL